MELDDLKQSWNKSQTNKLNTDIMELIKQKSYGPLAALKTTYRKQITMMLLLPVILLMTSSDNIEGALTSILFWSYVGFCIVMIVFARYNYRIVKKMEDMDGMVKTNLEQQIDLLEKRANLEIMVLRSVLLFFILLLELVPYIQHYRMLEKWHSLSPLIRFGTYAGFILLQFFMNKKIRQRKVGRHLTYLKTLVHEMQ
jgi:hypothetical protein